MPAVSDVPNWYKVKSLWSCGDLNPGPSRCERIRPLFADLGLCAERPAQRAFSTLDATGHLRLFSVLLWTRWRRDRKRSHGALRRLDYFT